MEYVVGPILALMLSMKFADWRLKQKQDELQTINSNTTEIYSTMNNRIELVETEFRGLKERNEKIDEDILKKVMTTITPIAKAVVKLNTEIGIR
tara:strand:- start:431 stop:712 length:282 start_codon:yes stop_codon:yes gene_type:complete